MRVLIFGATGGTGRQLISQARDRGHTVTAFARDPAALEGDGVRVVRGDALDADAVARAIPDHDAVLCALGRPAARPGRVRSRGTQNIVRAMQASGTRRLVCQSALGIGGTRRQLPPRYRWLLVPLLLRPTFAEHERQEAVVRDSGLDWTIVRAGALTDGGDTPTPGTVPPPPDGTSPSRSRAPTSRPSCSISSRRRRISTPPRPCRTEGLNQRVWMRSPCGPKMASAAAGPPTAPSQCGTRQENSAASPGSSTKSSSPSTSRSRPDRT